MVKQGAVELRQLAAPLLSGAALCPTVDMMARPPSCPVRCVQHQWPPGKPFSWKEMLCGLSPQNISLMTRKHSLPWPSSTCLGSRKGWRLHGHWGRWGEVGEALSLKGSFPETTNLGVATGAISNQSCPSASEDATVPSTGGKGNCMGTPTSSVLEFWTERPLTPVLPDVGRSSEGHVVFTSTLMSHDVVTGQQGSVGVKT